MRERTHGCGPNSNFGLAKDVRARKLEWSCNEVAPTQKRLKNLQSLQCALSFPISFLPDRNICCARELGDFFLYK